MRLCILFIVDHMTHIYKDSMYCVVTSDCSRNLEGYFYGPDMKGHSTGLSVRQLWEGYKAISVDYCVFH